MRLKKCVLSFLRKLVRDEISLMSVGSAFQARGPAIEKALSVTFANGKSNLDPTVRGLFGVGKLPFGS